MKIALSLVPNACMIRMHLMIQFIINSGLVYHPVF